MSNNGCPWCGYKTPEAHDPDCPNGSQDPTKQQTTLFDPRPITEPVIGGRTPTTRRPKAKPGNSRRGGRDGTGWIQDGSRRVASARGPAKGERSSDPNVQ